MLIATITALYLLFFAGGSGSVPDQVDQVSDLVSEHVADEQLATDAERVLEELRALLTEFPEQILELRRRVFEVDTDYASTRQDYEQAMAALDAAWLQHQERVVELRFQLRDLLSRQEWDAVFTALQETGSDG